MLPIYRQVLTVGTLVRIIITTCDMAARRASTSQRVVLSRVFPAGGRHGLRGEKRVIYNTGGVLVVCDVGGASMTSPLVAPGTSSCSSSVHAEHGVARRVELVTFEDYPPRGTYYS